MDPKLIRILSAAVCLFTIFEFCRGFDTLSADETLADGEVLIYRGQRFELGFFSPGKSTRKFLGIRYKATPYIVIWVANRNSPIMDSKGVLTLSKNGTLIVSTTPNENIWLFSPSRPASSPVLQLQDTGKLVLLDNSSKIWQSSGYPSDNGLPGMAMEHDLDSGESMNLTSWRSADDPFTGEYNFRIENQGLSQLVLRKGMKKIFRIVFWNGHFTGIPEASDPAWRTEVRSHRGRLISTFSPFDEIISTRWTLNHTGFLRFYIMNEQQDGWILMMSQPRDSCDNYGHCGNNGICRIYKTQVCDCLRGFKPKVEREWRTFNWERGCTRNLPSDCQKEDGFLKAWVYCKENRELELMDPCYDDSWVESQVRRCIHVGLLCVQNVPDYRPMMSSVILMLSSDDIVLPQPMKPGFFLQSSSRLSQRDASESTKYSRCMITTSDVEAR